MDYRVAGVILLGLSFGLRGDGCGDKSTDDSGNANATTGSTTGSTTGTTTGTTGTGTGAATGTGTGTGGVVNDCSGNLCIHYDPSTMVKSHQVGVSNCPDPLGDVEISNSSSEEATYTLTGPPVQPGDVPGVLFLDSYGYHSPSAYGSVPAGGSVVVPFFFSCYTTTSFTAAAGVDVTTSSEALNTTVPVDMTIN